MGEGRLVPRRRTLTLVVTIAVALLTVSPSVPASARSRSRHSRAETIRRQIRATRNLLRTAQARDDAITSALARYGRLLNREQSSLAAARGHLASINFQMDQALRRLGVLSTQRRARARVIAARARALYIMGPISGVQAMTGGGNLDDLLGRAGALEFVATFDRTVLQDLARIAHDTKQLRVQLGKERTRAADVQNEIADRAEAVGEIVSAKRDAHAQLQDSIDAYRQEIEALQREQARIQNIIRSRSGGYIGGGESARGYAWPTRGRHITSSYGYRNGGFHTGMDIDCVTGDPVAASKEGKVIASEWGGGYGNMVIIDHGGGYTTLYAHNSRLYVRDGEIVRQRQVISACGATGNSTGDHLHFEVRVNGNHRNPRPYLP